MTAPAALTLEQLFQLYAPLAGLLLFAFLIGGLFQRMKSVETRLKGHDDAIKECQTEKSDIAILGVHMSNMQKSMEKTERDVAGIQRTLGNWVAKGQAPGVQTFGQTDES